MTDEEYTNHRQKAEESYEIYSEHNHVDKYEGYQYIDGYCNGYEQGMKNVCKICEQKILEAHPDACGCAFRRLGNEYCWELDGGN